MNKQGAPDWFDLRDYDTLSGLGVAGWAKVLRKIRSFETETKQMRYTLTRQGFKFKPQAASSDPRRHKGAASKWSAYRPDYDGWLQFRSQSSRFESLLNESLQDLAIGGPAIESIAVCFDPDRGLARLEGIDTLTVADLTLHAEAYPLLKIDLFNPDRVILDAFTQWLIDTRKNFPLPLKQAGHQAKIGPEVTQDHLDRWTDARIVALWEIDFWAKRHRVRLTNAEIYNLLHPGHHSDEPEKVITRSRQKLRQALDLYVTLEAQALSRGEEAGSTN